MILLMYMRVITMIDLLFKKTLTLNGHATLLALFLGFLLGMMVSSIIFVGVISERIF